MYLYKMFIYWKICIKFAPKIKKKIMQMYFVWNYCCINVEMNLLNSAQTLFTLNSTIVGNTL